MKHRTKAILTLLITRQRLIFKSLKLKKKKINKRKKTNKLSPFNLDRLLKLICLEISKHLLGTE